MKESLHRIQTTLTMALATGLTAITRRIVSRRIPHRPSPSSPGGR